MDLRTAWERLDHRFQLSLGQAWSSLVRRGLPVGAVIALEDEILSTGRNRVYDLPGGPDPLQRTPLAHAEMNALASLSHEMDLVLCSIWSTHSPCRMCAAAIDFAGLESVHYLAADPSDQGAAAPGSEPDVSPWTVVANVMFLHNVAWVAGRGSAVVARSARSEPETTTLALRVLDEESFIRTSASGADLLTGLTAIWDEVVQASRSRLAEG